MCGNKGTYALGDLGSAAETGACGERTDVIGGAEELSYIVQI